MRLGNLIDILEQIAPTNRAESWDNVGLLVGDPEQNVSQILLTIDYTPQVAAEAKKLGAQLVIAYHPPIFHPLKQLTSSSLIWNAIRDGIALYSPHTALDVADGGTNDMLADVLGMVDRQPLRPASAQPTQCKLVVFVPQDAVDQVSQAIFDAGTVAAVFKAPEPAHFSATRQANRRSANRENSNESPKSAWKRFCQSNEPKQ